MISALARSSETDCSFMPLTEELAAFVSGTTPADLPPELITPIRTSFTDTIAVAIAGMRSPAAQAVAQVVRPVEAAPCRLLFFGPDTAYPEDAALVNGTAAHALDYDDVALDAHPGAVLVPAIVAAAQERGATGLRMVAAYAVGYETWAELYRRDPRPMYERGFHPTGVFGAVAAAAAVANLRGLERGIAQHALAIAASLASGLTVNFGSSTKPLHAGRAAQNGVLAARLAEAGMTAAANALEQGLLKAVSASGLPDIASPVTAGRPWRLAEFGLSVKLSPICFGAHRALDAILSLIATSRCPPAEIESVIVEIGRSQLIPLHHHRPADALQAKFSVEFAVASALLAGQCGLEQLRDDFVRSPDVQDLMQRVRIVPIDERDVEEPVFSPFDRVHLMRRDGTKLSSEPVRRPRGHPRFPVGTDALWRKFRECTPDLGANEGEDLFECLQRIDRIDDVRVLPVLRSCRIAGATGETDYLRPPSSL